MAETTESITARLLGEISNVYDKSDGSFIYDIERASAVEFGNAYDAIETVKTQSHPSTASGKYLEKCVSPFGLSRKKATYSTGTVTFYGKSGATIPKGSKVASQNIIYQTNYEVTIGNEGFVMCDVICDSIGSIGNVPSGYINRLPYTISSVTRVENENATTGGSDEETDSELLERYYEYVTRPNTSGNKYHYITWAKEVDGVGNAKCIPRWAGPGTVKVIIVADENSTADDGLVERVKDYIDTVRPIGADVTVVKADEITVNISCNAQYEMGSEENIRKNITDYLESISFTGGYISIAKIGQMILNSDGVSDYTNLTINGSNENIPIADTQIAVLGVLDVD